MWQIKVKNIALFLMMAFMLALSSLMCKAETTRIDSDSTISLPHNRQNIVKRIIHHFETSNKTELTRRPSFSIIGGPHYSSDTKLGIGLVAAGLYSTAPQDTTLKPSNISLFADITTGGFFKIGIDGLHLYRGDRRRVEYELSFNSYSTYFWGVGYDMARSDLNKSKYLLLKLNLNADHLWRISRNFYVGPMVKFDYCVARNIERPNTWHDFPRSTVSLGMGGRLQFDTRDNYTAPTSGWLCHVSQLFFPLSSWSGSYSHKNKAFASTELTLCKYVPVWRDGVIASRFHGHFTYGSTPWSMMPTVGGKGPMRGYYEGQYRDKCELDVAVELRQKVWRRSGVVVWGGLGTIFSKFSHMHRRFLLPSYGVGYRWEFKKLTNVRVDLGFGKKCWGVEFNINEAF